jgi:hypothetical protein
MEIQQVKGQMKENELLKKIEDLSKDLKNKFEANDELRIESETSYSESVIIGSRAAYARAGILLLKLATSDDTINDEIKQIFNEFGAVWPVMAYITDHDHEAQEIASELT